MAADEIIDDVLEDVVAEVIEDEVLNDEVINSVADPVELGDFPERHRNNEVI